MNRTDLEKNFLGDNATSAFAGVLLLAQARRTPSENLELPIINAPIVDFSDVLLIAVAAFLLIASFALALGSVVGWLRRYMLPIAPRIAPVLSILTLLAFIIGWFSAISELPADGLLREILTWGGLVMFIFLVFRVIQAFRESPYVRRS